MINKNEKRRGLAAVEFALLMPIMLLLIMLLAEGATAMHTYSSLVEASREGARHVIMEGDSANVEALIAALINDLDTQDITTNVVTDPVANTVTVEVSYDYQPFGSNDGAGILGGENDSIQLVAQTTMPLP
ncbi:TadE/TadG family type IV pilus assembly protein [Pseudodesulfovibrio sediminis]|uniref:Pilus biosynthesis protein TadE n=1 Tax=Pseudodesulfovibrio sediminis TaxID=2810563 RepID=A0ABM7P9F1_9BACT|nr:TadE/TadG family type IV pilus assembly protein [Pseudodesulfovibrio sediminis]BCS89615.1 pilus biosynthesis protein TadE [Pseudodesulfovibrio sediminis]